MKMYKKIVSTILLLALTIGMSGTVFANGSVFESSNDSLMSIELPDIISPELIPVGLPEPNENDYTKYDLPTISVDSLDELTDLDISMRNGLLGEMTRSGQYLIAENTMYQDTLVSYDDYTIYLCVITANGEATVFLDSTSTMDFTIEVLIFTDTSMSTQRTDDYSNVSKSLYGGQRIRNYVYTGEVIAILVAMNNTSTFASNIYSFGVLRHGYIGDSYEANNHPYGAYNLGTASVNGTVIYADIDSQYDIDWYKYSYSDKTCYTNLVFTAGYGVNAYLFTMSSNGELQFVKEIINDAEWRYYTNTTLQTYYIGVYSPSGGYGGNYAFGIQLTPIYMVEKSVIVDFSNVMGDKGLKSYGALGYRQTAQSYTYGQIRITDTKGNPISGFPYYIAFDTNPSMLFGVKDLHVLSL